MAKSKPSCGSNWLRYFLGPMLRYKYLSFVIFLLIISQFYIIMSFVAVDIQPSQKDAPKSSQIDSDSLREENDDGDGEQDALLASQDDDLGAELLAELENGKLNLLTAVQRRRLHNEPERTRAALAGVTATCPLVELEVLSAISRAQTSDCKQQLADFGCRLNSGSVYPKFLPNFCPHDGYKYGRKLGCFRDERAARLLPGYRGRFNTSAQCVDTCVRHSAVYAGVEFGGECWCGDVQPLARLQLNAEACNMTCRKGDGLCGGHLALDLYETGRAVFKVSFAETAAKEGAAPVRIVFLLTLNGRDVRQVHRLLKMLYHSSHFYLIHVDARQQFLYRSLLPLEDRYSNVRLARLRHAPIWGGVSLLETLLDSMKYLLKTSWPWDYVLNLSESDMPVKTLQELTDYLTNNRGKNFLKSHGQALDKFILKQGANHSFYECDNHLWRLGSRQLPTAAWNGGSDWVCLHRDFVEYSTSFDDDLVRGARIFFNHTLLPAESFFHVVLRSSRFCHTLVDNNLHLTNWRRSQGCHCQHRHVVDWCGCSPNDLLPADMPRLKLTRLKDLFFARKLESAVSHEAVTKLDAWVHGPLPDQLPALHAHWLNVYDHADTNTDDTTLTFCRSVGRMVVDRLRRRCPMEAPLALERVVSAHILKRHDRLEGSVLQMSLSGGRIVEALVLPSDGAIVRSRSSGVTDRLAELRIGTDFDQKETLFRNWLGAMGVFSTPVVYHTWRGGSEHNVSLVATDPAGVVARVDTLSLDASDAKSAAENKTGITRVALRQPLRPGVWTLRVFAGRVQMAHTSFTILPIEAFRSRRLNRRQAVALHDGPSEPYTDQLQQQIRLFQELIGGAPSAERMSESRRLSQRHGTELRRWIDVLVAASFDITQMCVAEASSSDGSCWSEQLPRCRDTDWSSLSPDPKSEMHGLTADGHMLRVPV